MIGEETGFTGALADLVEVEDAGEKLVECAEKDKAKQIEQARIEAREILDEAVKKAGKEREKILEKKQKEVDAKRQKILDEARKKAAETRKKAVKGLPDKLLQALFKDKA